MKSMSLFFPEDEEDRFTIGLVTGNDALPLRAGDEIDKFHCQIFFNMGMFFLANSNNSVGIEEPFVTLE
jgi:hypothetical protein